jgi:hypothetical protein
MLNYFNQVIAPANSELSKSLGLRQIDIKYEPSTMEQLTRHVLASGGKRTIHVIFDNPIGIEYDEESPREEALRDIESDFFNNH